MQYETKMMGYGCLIEIALLLVQIFAFKEPSPAGIMVLVACLVYCGSLFLYSWWQDRKWM